jgi:NADH-quinone oxidoreductase subunit M
MVGLITFLILIPLAGALALWIGRPRNARAWTLGFQALAILYVFLIWQRFDSSSGLLQLMEQYRWIPALHSDYLVGADGFSLLLLLLTSLLFPFAVLAQRGSRGLNALMLVMQAALYGTFTAQSFVLWFVFYETSLIPAFLLIRLWGGEKRDRASTKFFVYTFFGSVAMLLGFVALYLERHTFDFGLLVALHQSMPPLSPVVGWLAFAGIFLGLAVKVPLFPFHTWLPDAYETAPVGVSMVLTGALSKMGLYGFVRFLVPLFPEQIRIAGPWLLTLAVCSILFSSLAAWAQKDLKRMVAYLSINHLGYCLLALFAITAAADRNLGNMQAALSGVFLQIFNHGITAAALFYYVGLLEERRGARGLDDFGGLMQRTPLLCGWMSVAMFSSLGLPGLNGFIGEFLIFKGSFAATASFTAVAVFGLLFTAIVFLQAMQSLFSGPLSANCSAFPDLLRREAFVVVPVTVLMLVIGIAPEFLFKMVSETVIHMARVLS